MAHREELLQTGAVSSVFLGILVGLGYFQQLYFPGAFTDPILVAVALVPILFFLAVTGRLYRLSGGGFEIVLQEQARKFISPDAATEVDVEPERLDAKVRTAEIEDMKRRAPTALTFELEKTDYYVRGAILDYLETLETLRYVVFQDANGRFEGYSPVLDFIRLVQNYDVGVVEKIENREILDMEIVHTESIKSDSSNEECLRAMDDYDVNELAVVDSDGKFTGVVTQDEIIRKLVSSAITEV